MIQTNDTKKSFFDLDMFGLKLSPVWGVIIGLVLTVFFNGGFIGSIGAIIFLIGIIKLISNFLKGRKSKKAE